LESGVLPPHPSEKDSQAISVVMPYIESVKNMFDSDPRLQKGEILGPLSIIPIDESKEMYTRDSCKLMLLVFMYEEDDWHIQIINEAAEKYSTVFKVCFQIEEVADSNNYVAYPPCRFTSHYKTFMSYLYEEVEKRYPGKFEFDGSRIMSKAKYGTCIF